MPDLETDKSRLRDRLRCRRLELGATAQQVAAQALAQHVARLPGWAGIRRLALYLARDGEIDTTPLAARCRELGITLFLPVLEQGRRLAFAEWHEEAALVSNRYGIGEPPPSSARSAARELDAVCLPLVGWDREGGRLGMGGGFYDRTLAGDRGPLLVGLAHSCQEVPRVPRDPWDVQLDFIATDTTLVQCRGRR